MKRNYGISITDRGLRVYNANRTDIPNCSEYGTIYMYPYRCKCDTLRTCAQPFILLYNEV